MPDDEAFDGYADANPTRPSSPPPRSGPLAKRNAEKSTKPNGSRLTPAELVTIAQLAANHVSIADIARAVGRHAQTIRANLQASKQLLEAFAPEFVTDWKHASSTAATRGDHRPAMDALERIGLIEAPKKDPLVPPFQVNVGIALPGLPAQELHSVKHSVLRETSPEPLLEATAKQEPEK